MLVYAHRGGTPEHEQIGAWLEDIVNSDSSFAVSSLVLSGLIRIVTHPRVFARPTPLERALAFADSLRGRPNCVELAPGPRHWAIFTELCREGDTKGNRVPDAYHAALAIESGSEWVTTDRGFARFPGLHWRHPLS